MAPAAGDLQMKSVDLCFPPCVGIFYVIRCCWQTFENFLQFQTSLVEPKLCVKVPGHPQMHQAHIQESHPPRHSPHEEVLLYFLHNNVGLHQPKLRGLTSSLHRNVGLLEHNKLINTMISQPVVQESAPGSEMLVNRDDTVSGLLNFSH